MAHHFNQRPPNFGVPNQNMRMLRPGGPPRFNRPCPWGPPQMQERPKFNISRFMHPPHSMADDTFAPNSATEPHGQFSHNNQQGPHVGTQMNFRGQGPHGRGFMRGNRGGPGYRGGFRGSFNGSQPNPTGKGKKKEKVNKRDLPENNAFFCDTCDRGFKTEEKYKEHTDGHIKCSYKDCPYIAAPKLVHLHTSLQHRSGLAKKVWSLESEEDVSKWREDRKRNYPTSENIAKKRQENEAKIARGEVLETKDFSKMRGKGRHRGHGHDRGGRSRRGRGRGRWKDGDQMGRNQSEMRCGEEKALDGSDDDSPPEEVTTTKSSKVSPNKNDTQAAPEVATSDKHASVSPTQTDKQVKPGGLAMLASYGDSSSDTDSNSEEEDNNNNNEVPKRELSAAESSLPSSVLSKANRLPNPFSSPPSKTVSTSHTPNLHPTPNDIPSVQTEHVTQTIQDLDTDEKDVHQAQSDQVNVSVGDTVQKSKRSPRKNSSVDKHTLKNNMSPSESTEIVQSEKNRKKEIADATNPNKISKSKESTRKDNKNDTGLKRKHEAEKVASFSHKKKKGPSMQPKRKYTLLEKLLAPDIRRERNKILQCVHYIVKNKFFETNSACSQMASSSSCSTALPTVN